MEYPIIINIPYSQAKKVAGNSVSVPVIKAIAGEMIKALNEQQAIKQDKELNLFENSATNKNDFNDFKHSRGYDSISLNGIWAASK